MNKVISKEIVLDGKKLVLETGEIAFQTNMSVKASYGDTVVLVTVVAGEAKPDTDFFPLTVNYEEKLYASGLIKTSRFVKRDGKATDEAIINKRLIDHAIRPLFPRDYMDEVQVVATILSLADDADPEFLAMVATSAALHASDVPWEGPMTSAKVGFVKDAYVLNPSVKLMEEESELDMMVSFAGKDRKFLAVEAEANILPEDKILGAINFAREGLVPVLDLIEEFAKEVNPEHKKYVYISKALDEQMLTDIDKIAGEKIKGLLKQDLEKTAMKEGEALVKDEVLVALEGKYKKVDMLMGFEELEKRAIQHLILDEEHRPDGRGIHDIRTITTRVGVLPRTHGSALFTRGVTQALTVATLGSPSLELFIQDMYGEKTKRYIHYYNFPPFAVGETGNMGSPKSREIGHGMLAEKALKAVIPSQKDFPYMIVVVSETLSSSGSSSMAATCGSTLSLMDAGVPIKDMVAGVGVGLMANDDFSKYKLMTDLAYKEDAFGFLDFKMTGTRTGVTAMQADMKAFGIPIELVSQILEESRVGRMKVLDEMQKTLAKPREAVSERAPKMIALDIPAEKIGMVIGSGGRTIKDIQEQTQTEVMIEENGHVVVSGVNLEMAQKAAAMIAGITKDIEVGEVYDGTVKEILDFGALVEVLPGKVGLLHVSELDYKYVENVRSYLSQGDVVKVKVIAVGEEGKFSLSKKALEPKPEGYEEPVRPERPQRPSFRRGGGHSDFRSRR